MELEELLAAITPADQSAMEGCRKNWMLLQAAQRLGHAGGDAGAVAGATGKTVCP